MEKILTVNKPDVLSSPAFTRIGDVEAPTGKIVPIYEMDEFFNTARGWNLWWEYGSRSKEYQNAKSVYYFTKKGGAA
jgi:hypothetical protein